MSVSVIHIVGGVMDVGDPPVAITERGNYGMGNAPESITHVQDGIFDHICRERCTLVPGDSMYNEALEAQGEGGALVDLTLVGSMGRCSAGSLGLSSRGSFLWGHLDGGKG